MTFDEATRVLLNGFTTVIDENGEEEKILFLEDVQTMINELRVEYVSTIEMTKGQKDIIIGLFDNSDISQDYWEVMITDDNPELPEISYRQAIMAYMNPKIIKLVDE